MWRRNLPLCATIAAGSGIIGLRVYNDYTRFSTMNCYGLNESAMIEDIRVLKKLDLLNCFSNRVDKIDGANIDVDDYQNGGEIILAEILTNISASGDKIYRAQKLDQIKNVYESLLRGNSEESFDCCVNLLSYYVKKDTVEGQIKDPFLSIPHMFLTRAARDDVARCGSRHREAASHYGIYTRNLCLTYFIREKHYITYVHYLIKQQLYEALLFSGLMLSYA